MPDSEFTLRTMDNASGSGPNIYVPSSSSSRTERSYIKAARNVLTEVYPHVITCIIHEQQVASVANGRNGLSFTRKKFSAPISAISPIPGLYFCGKDIATSGLAGDIQGGYIAACAVLGYSRQDLISGKNIAVDIQNLIP